MTATFLAKKWDRQPLGPVTINPSHPIAGGLAFAYLGTNDLDIVSGQKMRYSGTTGYASKVTDQGIARHHNSTSVPYVRTPVSARPASNTGGISGWYRIKLQSTGNLRYYIMGREYSGTNNTFGTYVNAGSFNGFIRGDNTGTVYTTSAGVAEAANTWYDFGVTYVGTNLKFYSSGSLVGSATTPGDVVSASNICVGATSGAYGELIPVQFLWRGEHPEYFALLEKEGPWGIFMPKKQPIFYSLGGAYSNISGNPTESVDTSSGTLSLSLAISGAVSEVVDSATGQISNVVSLTGTVTESTDVSTGSVDLEVNVTGTTVEQLDTSSGTVSLSDGSVYISGTITETRDTGSGSVAVVTAVEGVVTEGSDTVSGTLQTTVSLTGTVLENSDSITGSVSILGALSVTGTVTESSDTLSGYLDNPEAQGTKGGNGKAKLKKKKKVKVSVDTSELDTLVQQLQTDGKVFAVTQIESVKNILDHSELEIPAAFSEAAVIAETLVKTSVETTDEWALNMIKTLLTHILVLQDKLQDAEDVILLLSSD